MSPTTEILQYITIVLKPDLSTPPSASSPPTLPAALRDVLVKLKSAPGVISVQAGSHHEVPERWTAFVRWSSASALDSFAGRADWLASVEALADAGQLIVLTSHMAGPLAGVLSAPCVEVFTAYGTADGWLEDRMAPFAEAVAAGKLPGHHGTAYGAFEHPTVADGPGSGFPAGAAVRGLLGWDTVEAHLAQRGEGKLIDNNIHYLRGAREKVDMFHVYLAEV